MGKTLQKQDRQRSFAYSSSIAQDAAERNTKHYGLQLSVYRSDFHRFRRLEESRLTVSLHGCSYNTFSDQERVPCPAHSSLFSLRKTFPPSISSYHLSRMKPFQFSTHKDFRQNPPLLRPISNEYRLLQDTNSGLLETMNVIYWGTMIYTFTFVPSGLLANGESPSPDIFDRLTAGNKWQALHLLNRL